MAAVVEGVRRKKVGAIDQTDKEREEEKKNERERERTLTLKGEKPLTLTPGKDNWEKRKSDYLYEDEVQYQNMEAFFFYCKRWKRGLEVAANDIFCGMYCISGLDHISLSRVFLSLFFAYLSLLWFCLSSLFISLSLSRLSLIFAIPLCI